MVLGQIKDLFYRRAKFLRGELAEAYSYELSTEVRHKIIGNIFDNNFTVERNLSRERYDELYDFVITLERQFGRNISPERLSPGTMVRNFLSSCDKEEFLSALEVLLAIKIANSQRRPDHYNQIRNSINSLINEVNKIFRLEKIGYEIIPAGIEDLPFMVVPFNSKYLYLETIKLPRELLNDNGFNGPLQEFDEALDDFRKDKFKDSVHKAAKAYESTLKSILSKLQIEYNSEEIKLHELIDKFLESEEIFPRYLGDSLKRVGQVLKSGVPPIRNREAGHGQGIDIKNLEKSYAEFALHLTGAYIVFMINRYSETR